MIDRAGHYEILTRLIDGAQQIEIGADDSPYALNPWDVPDPAKVSREKIAFLLALHQVMMGGLDARQIGLIGPAIRAVYAKAAQLPGSTPRESMLQDELRAQAREAHDADAVDVAATLRNLADRLSEYCGEGTYAYLLDRETTVPLDAPLVVFDTRRCPESELRLVMFQVMEYVTATVERHWQAHRTEAGTPGRAAVPRPLDHADRRGVASDQPPRDRRVRQQPRPPRPPPRAGADRHVPAAVGLRHRARGRAAGQLLPAAAARAEPEGDPVHRRHSAALRARGRRAARLKTVKGRHAQMLWLNGTRGRGKVALRVGPTEYWAFTSDPTEVAIREAEIERHGGNVWAAIAALAKRGTRAHRNRQRLTRRRHDRRRPGHGERTRLRAAGRTPVDG